MLFFRNLLRPAVVSAAAALFLLAAGCERGGGGRPWADLDNDGIHDADDPDIDGDGFLNANDAFPRDPFEFYDSDADGVGNYAQLDEDGDGTADLDDAFPFDPKLSVAWQYEEEEFNDNLKVANPVAKELLGVRSPPPGLDPRARLPVVRGQLQVSGDVDVFLIAPPPGKSISFVVRAPGPAADISPVRVGLSDLDGKRIPVQELDTGAPGRVAAWRAAAPAEVSALIVSDGTGEGHAGLAYELHVVTDKDGDGVGDDREVALGMKEFTPDSEGDGLFDAGETVGLTVLDADADGGPNWLDADSDGDGLHDAMESARDHDRDGTPSFADVDADGNGTADSAEPGVADGAPTDLDRDGVPDVFDLDDDADGIPDPADPNPTVPDAPAPRSANHPALLAIRWSHGQMNARDVGRRGDPLQLVCDPLGSDAVSRFDVLFARTTSPSGENFAIAEARSVAGRELEVLVPRTAQSGPVHLLDTKTGQLTNAHPFRVLARGAPIVSSFSRRVLQPGALVTLGGAGFSLEPGVTNVDWDGQLIRPETVAAAHVRFRVPQDVTSGFARVVVKGHASNGAFVTVTRNIAAEVEPPRGSSFAGADLTIDSGLVALPRDLGRSRRATVTLPHGTPSVLQVTLTKDENAPPVLLAVAGTGAGSIDIDARSTAVALCFMAAAAFLGDAPPAAERERLYEDISAHAGTADLARLISEQLVKDAGALAKLDARALARIAAILKDSIPKGWQPSSAAGGGSNHVTITPEEAEGFRPVPRKGQSAYVDLENDTMLYASVAYYELTQSGGKGRLLVPHARSVFDLTSMAGPNSGPPLFLAATTRLAGPNGIDAWMEVITPGVTGAGLARNAAVKATVAVRTMLFQMLAPTLQIVANFAGAKLSSRVWAKILYENLGPQIEQAMSDYVNGRLSFWSAFRLLGRAIQADIVKGPDSALLKAAARALGKKALEKAVMKALAKRLLVVLNLIDAGSAIGGLAFVGATSWDIGHVPDLVEFKIEYDLQIDEVSPDCAVNYHWDIREWDLDIEIEGRGMLPADGWQAWRRDESKVRILLGNAAFPVERLNRSGTRAGVRLAMKDVERLPAGKLPVIVEVEGLRSNELAIDVYDRPHIKKVSPGSGEPDDVVRIEGVGFFPFIAEHNVVTFTGILDPVVGETKYVDRRGTRLLVVVPHGFKTGPLHLRCPTRWDDDARSNDYPFGRTDIVEITYVDNGSLKDDIFALYIDGVFLSTTSGPTWPAVTVEVPLQLDTDYRVELRGIAAPDEIGTYGISFSDNVEVLPGSDPLEGIDLIRGARKQFFVRLKKQPARASRRGFSERPGYEHTWREEPAYRPSRR